ncbi:MAG: hypothetical protein CMI67_25185 [Pelagibaca sp.]|nr:hypothetical protein [Pelagibaca sp.]
MGIYDRHIIVMKTTRLLIALQMIVKLIQSYPERLQQSRMLRKWLQIISLWFLVLELCFVTSKETNLNLKLGVSLLFSRLCFIDFMGLIHIFQRKFLKARIHLR